MIVNNNQLKYFEELFIPKKNEVQHGGVESSPLLE